ncbi:MAG: hypothetical protein RLZZ267_420 [Bacillota bacterium]|jgi:hypothetical protein
MIINPKHNMQYTLQYCLGGIVTFSYMFAKYHSQNLWFDISLIFVITLCVVGSVVSGYKIYKIYKHDQNK